MYPRLGCLAEAGEQEAITRPAAWPLDLALADAHLILENQALKPEFGLGMTPVDEGVPSRISERGTGVGFGAGGEGPTLPGWPTVLPLLSIPSSVCALDATVAGQRSEGGLSLELPVIRYQTGRLGA